MFASLKTRIFAFLCVCAGFCALAEYTIEGDTATVSTYEDLVLALANEDIAIVKVANTIALPDGAYLCANDLSSQERKIVQVEKPFLSETYEIKLTKGVTEPKEDEEPKFDTIEIPAADSYSKYNLFDIAAESSVTISNLTLKGGFKGKRTVSGDDASTGGIENKGRLVMYDVDITQTGTALLNHPGATAVLVGCNIVRNANWYGGGILNFAESYKEGDTTKYKNGGTVIMDGCSLTENESLGPSHGGGAAENQGLMCLNNCVIANNASTEIGGGINNCKNGTLYVMNCTFTGNITTSQDYGVTAGGAIGNAGHAGNVYIVNSILANNGYDTGEHVNPVCLGRYEGASGDHQCTVVNTVIGATAGMSRLDANNISTKVDGLFSGYTTQGIIAAGGGEDGRSSEFSHPDVIKEKGYEYALVPVMQSQEANHYLYTMSVPTYFDYSGIVAGTSVKPVMAFETNGVITVLGKDVNSIPEGVDKKDVLVDKTFNGGSRLENNALGAVTVKLLEDPEKPDDPDIFMVRLGEFTGGKVSGVTVYGDSYISNSAITVHAVADSAYYLKGWDINGTVVEGSSHKYVFTFRVIKDDTVITPLFQPVITGITAARQRYPWNNLVDIDYMITEEDAVDYRLVFVATFEDGGTNRTVQLKSFVSNTDGRTPISLGTKDNEYLRQSGEHRVTWDSAADGVELKNKNVRLRLMACEGTER